MIPVTDVSSCSTDPRLYNPQEGCWMGRERKRGKIEDFNALLAGDDRPLFSRTVGDVSRLTSIRYVITLDTDTDLPWGSGWRLVGAAAHPLNRPTMDPAAGVWSGATRFSSRASASRFAAPRRAGTPRLLAGEVGIDPYTRVVSDVYQDLFAEASFIGKGIYDVGAFRQLLDGRFPDNTVLSHDLLESCYARSGQCSDVELLEDSPSSYLADVSRRHRWMRGDWQIAPWLGLRVSNARGHRLYPSIAALGRWKIFDNLRRALVAPAFTTLLALGWIVSPTPLPWTLAVLALLFVPELLPGMAELMQRPPKLPIRRHVAHVGRSTRAAPGPDRAVADVPPVRGVGGPRRRGPFAVADALQPATHARMAHGRGGRERGDRGASGHVIRRMWVGPGMGVAITAMLIGTGGAPRAGAVVGPILVLWFLSPLVAWRVSRPIRSESTDLGEEDVQFLRRIARLTWRYFEVFVGPKENWLPPRQRPGKARTPRGSPHQPDRHGPGAALQPDRIRPGLRGASGSCSTAPRTRSSRWNSWSATGGHFVNWYDTSTRRRSFPSTSPLSTAAT